MGERSCTPSLLYAQVVPGVLARGRATTKGSLSLTDPTPSAYCLVPAASSVQLHHAGAVGDSSPCIRLSRARVINDARGKQDGGEESHERNHDRCARVRLLPVRDHECVKS